MPKNPIIASIFLYLFLIFGACSTGRYTISVLEPAPYNLPAGIHRVTILPLIGMDQKYASYNKPIIYGMYDALNESPFFQKVALAKDSVLKLLVSDSTLNWKDIGKLCRYDTTEVLLILREIVKADSIYDYGDGYMNYFMLSQTTWEFYNPYTMKEMVTFIYADTSELYHNVGIIYMDQIKSDIGYYSGYRAGHEICPYWKNVERLYFKGPGREMRSAARLVRKNQWNDAGLIWDQITQGSKKGRIARASHNIALAYERNDMLDQALSWEQYADSLSNNSIIPAYRKELEDRAKKKLKLDEQMNGD